MQEMRLKTINAGFRSEWVFVFYALAAVVLYWNGLRSPWLNACAFDQMLAFPFAIRWRDLIHLFSSSYHNVVWENEYHPLVTLIYFLNARLGGDNVVATKILNLIFIFLSSSLVYVVGRHVIKHRLWAFIAGLLFLTHPINSEPISVPDMNTDLIMTFFSLLAILAHIKFRQTLQKRYLTATAIAYILALFSKETAIVLPAIMFFYDILLPEDSGQKRGIRIGFLKEYVVMGLIAFCYLALQLLVINTGQFKLVSGYNSGIIIAESARNLIAALKYLVLPGFFVYSVSAAAVFGTIALLAVIFKVESQRLSWRWPAFCLLWILFGVLPVLGILPLQGLSRYLHSLSVNGVWISRRYLFLSAAAFCWLLASFLRHLSRPSFMKLLGVSLLAAILFNNVRVCGLSVFSDKANADTVHARIISFEAVPDYAFKSTLFSESTLTSLGYFLKQSDKRLLNKVKGGLKQDFTQEQVDAIVGYFGDVSLHKKADKARVYFSVRNIKNPVEFWAEFMRLAKEGQKGAWSPIR